jgi:EAL domain-containing protein (putative c-di-GMP-specific phosphodiesterase class I)
VSPRGAAPLPTPSTKAASPADASAQANTAESLGWQLRAALPPLRLHSVSIYDVDGEVRWLSEGALGPDEHGFVVEAIGALRAANAPAHREVDLQDNRGAVFLAVRSPRGELVGLVMILVDAKTLQGLGTRIVTPQVRAILQSMAILLRPPGLTTVSQRLPTLESAPPASPAPPPTVARTADRRTAPAAAASRLPPEVEQRVSPQADRRAVPRPAGAGISANTGSSSAPSRAQPVAAAPATKDSTASNTLSGDFLLEILEPRQTDDVLTFELTENVPVLAPAEKSAEKPVEKPANVAARRSSGPELSPRSAADKPLQIQELVKLRAGGRTRRMRILPRSDGTDQAFDALALTEVVAWLRLHPELSERSPMSFAIGVPEHALEGDRLPSLIASCFRQGGMRPESIGFEIQEQVCVRHRAQAERLIAQCEKLGCFFVLDDFSFHSEAMEMLRSKALRLVKVDPKLTSDAMREKLAQARVIAIAQAAKVLGIHCSAKQVDSQAARRWLTAIGFDFAESSQFDGPRSLESLLALPAAQ